MDSFKDVLEAAQAYCKTQMAEPTYNLYIDGLEPISFEDSSHITLSVRNDFICKIVTDRYLGLLKEAFKTVLGFDVDITLDHVTEGHLIVRHLVKAGKPVLVGPSFGSKSKQELKEKSFATAGILDDAGLEVCIITDAPVIPLYYLPLCAGLAVKAGMDPFDAFRAITINPAEHIGIADRVGSLEVGKDADIAIADGCPFEIATRMKYVFIDGVNVLENA